MIQLLATPTFVSATVVSMPIIVFLGITTAISEAGGNTSGFWHTIARIAWIVTMSIASPFWVIQLGYSAANLSIFDQAPEFYAANLAGVFLATFILAIGITPLVYILRKKKRVKM